MIDLLRFCDRDNEPEKGKVRLDTPWIDHGVAYASDRVILIRCNAKLWNGMVGPDHTESRRPKIDGFMNGVSAVTEWRKFEGFEECRDCHGKVDRRFRCDTCHGIGACEGCACGKCGTHQCEDCGGKGMVRGECDCVVSMADRRVYRAVMRKASELPEAEWGVTGDDPEGIVYFRFKGGDGALMPLGETEV